MNRSSKRTAWAVAGALACAATLGYSASSAAQDGKGSLEARLQAVEDRQAIEQLMVGDYPLALDRRLWKEYAATFTEDGELVQGKTVTKGRKAIEELFSRPRVPRQPPVGEAPAPRPAPPPPGEFGATKHVVTNLRIALNGNTATATAYWQTIAIRSGSGGTGSSTVVAAAGHYVDALQKVNGKWLFTRREIVNPIRPEATGAAPSEATR